MRSPIRALLSVASLCAAAAGCAGSLAGGPSTGEALVRLMHQERAVPLAEATAVRNPGVAFLEERVVATAGPDGNARLVLSPGVWYVFATGGKSTLFGWYGTNPVQVRAGETLQVPVPAVAVTAPAVASPAIPGQESVSGRVVGPLGAVVGADVAFYLDGTTQFRGPGYLEVRTDEQGAFEANVSPGRYWLIARRRSGVQAFGPLDIGDDFGFFPGNPVEVHAGQRVAVRIPTVPVLKKSGWSGPSSLRVRVGGTIRDAAGKPLAGYRAFLHAKPTMLGKPEYVSEPSGPDGGYLIWVDREGTFYLGARAEIGRSREESEAVGLYQGAPAHAVAVRLGAEDLTGRDIVVDVGAAP